MHAQWIKAIVALMLLLPLTAAAQQQLKLMVNESSTMTLAPNTQVMVGDDTKLAVKLVTPTQLLVKGLAAGYTDVWLINDTPKRVQVTIEQAIDQRLLLELEALTAHDRRLSYSQRHNFLVVKGQVSDATAVALKRLSDEHTQLLDQTQRIPVDAPMLRLRVKILELKRQHLKELGIEWQSATSGPTASSAIQGVFAWSAELTSTLNLLQTQGHAELLASPTLSAQSGESAAFLAGGEIPIPQVLAQGMQDVSFREYGIKLTIAPEVTATGNIKTQLSAEVSNLDPAVSVNGVPGILTRRTDSVFLSEEGDTLVLSGLLSLENSLAETQAPGLGDIPLLGQLFRSREIREQQTELLILVTTERLDAAQQRQQQQQQQRRQQRDWLIKAGCVGLQEVTDE